MTTITTETTMMLTSNTCEMEQHGPVASSSAGVIPLAPDVFAVKPRDRSSSTTQKRRSTFHHIPEVRDLTWEDSFYEGDNSVIAVFDYDEEQREIFNRALTRKFMCAFGLNGIIFWGLAAFCFIDEVDLSMAILYIGLGCWFAYFGRRMHKMLRSIEQAKHHLAATTDGLKFDLRGSGDVSNVTVMLPYQEIESCTFQDRKSGRFNPFGCFSSDPSNVTVLTIQKVGATIPQKRYALKNPEAIIKLVEVMKRLAADPVPAVASLAVEDETAEARGDHDLMKFEIV